jgi:hypothetical protein
MHYDQPNMRYRFIPLDSELLVRLPRALQTVGKKLKLNDSSNFKNPHLGPREYHEQSARALATWCQAPLPEALLLPSLAIFFFFIAGPPPGASGLVDISICAEIR